MIQLDWAVWDIRRYCISYYRGSSPRQQQYLASDLRHIEDATNYPPQRYRSLSAGFLEEVLGDKGNSARPALIWNNMYFGSSRRNSVQMRQRFSSHNPPLALYPQIIPEVQEYVYLPKSLTQPKQP